MKNSVQLRKLLLFAAVILFSTLLSAQNFQYVVNNNPNIHKLNCIYFPNPAIGYAVGDSGTIVKTIDSGYTWASQTSNINYNLSSVRFLNANTGWAVGNSGTILKTTDGGNNWMNKSYSTIYSFTSVYCINQDTCFITSSNVSPFSPPLFLKTTDGGITWINDSLRAGSIYFSSKDTGFVAECDTIYRTFNGGGNWSPVAITNSCACLYNLNFPSPATGYAYLDEDLCKTTNGGADWFRQYSFWQGSPFCNYLSSVFFTSLNSGFATHNGYWGMQCENWNGSSIFRTTNGGTNWFGVNNPASSLFLSSSFFTDSATGFIAGGPLFSGLGFILRTGNAVTSIRNNLTNSGMHSIYPNPSTGSFTVQLTQQTKYVQVSNSLGQTFEKRNFNNEKEMNFIIKENGIYFVQIVTDKEVITKKLIINNK